MIITERICREFGLTSAVQSASADKAMVPVVRLRRWAFWISVSIVLFGTIPSVSAQMIEQRQYRGKTIMCVLSGLRGWGSPCGTDGNYAYIFVGSVLSATEISETEKSLQIIPQEVFLGDDASPLKVTTNQGACLPEIMAGDQWLFYLYRDDKTKKLMLSYGSPSAPVAQAQSAIKRLRSLAAMTDTGMITGFVQRSERSDRGGFAGREYIDVSNHKLIAKRKSDGVEYSALTDEHGHYEFGPLPAGSYHLTANTTEGLWAQDGPTTVHPRSCMSYGFELEVDGRISGRITSDDGKPFKIHPWVYVMSEDGSHSKSAYVDDNGYFEVRGLEPDRYLIGIGIQDGPETPEWRSRVYYPGVRTKEEAIVIELGKAKKRTDIDFKFTPPVSR